MSWANMSNDPSSDERVLKDAQRTIERIVEAMKTALDDELAVQQMEYDQLFGVNSMQFAMYQTLVMTFFQDHQMLASLNLKRSRPDLSQGVPEQKRAYLMEVIAERVSSAGPPAIGQQQPFAQMQNAGQQGQSSGAQPPAPWAQQPQPAAQAPTASWLDPQPAASPQPDPGDWLNQSNSKERPPITAWPTANDESSNWTLKPGGGQPPAMPASDAPNGSNGAGWATPSNSWPTPEGQKPNPSSGAWPTVPEPAQVGKPENQWSGGQAGSPGWSDQPGAKQPLPAAAWPASNSGAAPALPQPPVAPPGVARPNFNTPIGESGMSGTWTLPPKPTEPPAPAWDSSTKPAHPPAPAWGETPQGVSQNAGSNGNYGNQVNQPAPGQLPAPAWSSASTPSQEMAAWNQPAPQAPPAPAWSSPANAMPVPEVSSASNQVIQPWQTPSPGSGQSWQPEPPATPPAPAWQAPPASITQSGVNAQIQSPPAPAWEAPPASITQPPAQPAAPQPWQQPPNPSTQPWEQPAPPAPPQMQQPQPQPQPQPWQSPGTAGGAWGGQPGGQQPFPPQPVQNQQMPYQQMPMQGAPAMPSLPPQPMQQMPPIPTGVPAQQDQGWTPPDSPWGGAEGNGAAPWAQNGMPPPAGSPPVQYQNNNGQPAPFPQGQYPSNGQGMPPQGAPNQMTNDDMSINFNQPNQPQNSGGTLSGVLRQMRSPDNKPKREEEERQDSYNPNTAW